jgi:hypothetical protein
MKNKTRSTSDILGQKKNSDETRTADEFKRTKMRYQPQEVVLSPSLVLV